MKRGAVWIAGLALAGLAVVVWQASLPAVGPGVVLVPRATSPAAAVALPSVVQASAQPATGGEGDTTSAADMRPETHWDLCGLGRFPVPKALSHRWLREGLVLPPPPPHLLADAALAQAPRIEAKLSTMGARGESARLAFFALGGDDETAQRNAATRLQVLAESGQDPWAWRWLAQVCRQSRLLACDASVGQRWAAAEPDNAAALVEPVLARLASLLATQPVDEAALAEALTPLAAAEHFSVRWMALSSTLLEAMPADAPGYAQQALLQHTIGIDAAMSLPSLSPVSRACRGATRADSPLRAPCERIARTWTNKADTFYIEAFGLAVGRDWLWSTEEYAARRGESQELQRVWSSRLHGFDQVDSEAARQPFSCAAVAVTRRWLTMVGRYGEIGALRKLRADSTGLAATMR
jgi:hypothetical protein